MNTNQIVIVAMPWASLAAPSIQIGLLTTILERAGHDVAPRSYFMEMGELLYRSTKHLPPEQQLTYDEYVTVSERLSDVGAGDWLFAGALDATSMAHNDDYLAFLRRSNIPEKSIAVMLAVVPHVPRFIDECVADIMACRPRIVGFTSTFNQNVPSLAVAKRLKQIDPSITVVFGGANVEGPMGLALHGAFDCIDVIVQGEAELSLPLLVSELLAGNDLAGVPGIVYRRDGAQVVNERPIGATVPVDLLCAPKYDEFFERLRSLEIRTFLDARVYLPVESSRGCWWGQVSHCTFCGLNGTTMSFRSKNAALFTDEMLSLSRRHQKTKFAAVDNILDMKYFDTCLRDLSTLRASGHDLSVFFETKANLKKEHLRRLRAAGVISIQPGIESLSTPILKLMGKGVTALQNIRLLKWAREYEIEVRWNLLWGFPGETADQYDAMAELVPSLTHLKPPGMAKLKLQRFSPYFDRPRDYGITVSAPEEYYKHIYQVDGAALADIAYSFDFEYDVPQPPVRETLRRQIVTWRKSFNQDRNSLMLERGLGFITINDRRPNLPQTTYTFSSRSAAIYLACDAGMTIRDLLTLFGGMPGYETISADELLAFLRKLVDQRLMFEENNVYLALAVADQPLVSNTALVESMVDTDLRRAAVAL